MEKVQLYRVAKLVETAYVNKAPRIVLPLTAKEGLYTYLTSRLAELINELLFHCFMYLHGTACY